MTVQRLAASVMDRSARPAHASSGLLYPPGYQMATRAVTGLLRRATNATQGSGAPSTAVHLSTQPQPQPCRLASPRASGRSSARPTKRRQLRSSPQAALAPIPFDRSDASNTFHSYPCRPVPPSSPRLCQHPARSSWPVATSCWTENIPRLSSASTHGSTCTLNPSRPRAASPSARSS
jgi:hypothetical protein